MHIRTKYFLGSFVVVLGSLAFAAFARAADVTAENSVTGANSTNTTAVELNSSSEVNVTNNANITNDITVRANTGGNSASENTGSGIIRTGDANVSASSTTNVNSINLGRTGAGSDLSNITAVNSTTGARSRNDNEINIQRGPRVNVQNDATINNRFNSTVNTGENRADENTFDGIIDTGDASSRADFSTIANRVALDLGDGIGNINAEIGNTCTGFRSDNMTELTLADNAAIDVENVANINNEFVGNAITGQNSASENTCGDSIIRTGDADFRQTVRNEVNEALIRTADRGNIDVTLLNSCTGAESENDIALNINREESITDIQNRANITNEADIEAITGENRADENTRGARIDTGDVDATFDFRNAANVVRFDGDGGSDIAVTAENRQTGFRSGNDIAVNIADNGRTTIDNVADVVNNIVLNAITGRNSASENTRGGRIFTGDVDVNGRFANDLNNVELSALRNNQIDVEASNFCTGANSENEVDLLLNPSNLLTVENETNLRNVADVESETGENRADENTCNGEIDSGFTDVNIVAETAGGNISDEFAPTLFDDNFFQTGFVCPFDKTLSGEGNLSISVNGDDIL